MPSGEGNRFLEASDASVVGGRGDVMWSLSGEHPITTHKGHKQHRDAGPADSHQEHFWITHTTLGVGRGISSLGPSWLSTMGCWCSPVSTKGLQGSGGTFVLSSIVGCCALCLVAAL